MGNYFTVNMEKNYDKNHDFLQAKSKAGMERLIQLQYQMAQRQMAMQLARNRDFTLWLTAFYAMATTGLISSYRKTRRPALLAPIMPLTFVVLYSWDQAYGNKLYRIRNEAENIMTHESDKLEWPYGLPTPESISLACEKAEEKKKIDTPLS